MTLLRRGPRTRRSALEVVVEVAEGVDVDDPPRWANLARSVLEAEGMQGPAELALSFIDEAAMAELNRRWMGEDGPTDVLSWSIDAPSVDVPSGEPPPDDAPSAMGVPDRAGPGRAGGPGGARQPEPVLLGDVVVCPAVARRAVADDGARLDDELALLVVHGVLHVLGLDHADAADEAAMQARERRHLTRFHDRQWTRTS